MQYPEKRLLAAFNHLGQRHRVARLDLGRRVIFDPLQEFFGQLAASGVVAFGGVRHFSRVAAPGEDVKELFQVALGVVFGGF